MIPLTDQAPPLDAVVVRVIAVPPPVLVRTSVTVVFAGAVPLAPTLALLPLLIGSVTDVIVGAATLVTYVAVFVDVPLMLPAASFAVAA